MINGLTLFTRSTSEGDLGEALAKAAAVRNGAPVAVESFLRRRRRTVFTSF